MAKKQPEITEETKQNLKDAYWDLYSSDMPGKITVKMITDRAGYNRGTFYAYFLDIDDVHTQIEEELLPSDDNFQILKEATFSKNSQQIIEVFMQMNRASGKKLSFLLGPRGSLSFQSKLKETLRDLILKHLPLDLKEANHVVDYKAEILCGLFYETICYWYNRGNHRFTEEEMVHLMLNIIYTGITEQP